MNFMNLFAYIELATGGVSAVVTIQHLVGGTDPITGDELVAAIQPVFSGLSVVFPKMKVPVALVLDICNGAADTINTYLKKTAAAAPTADPALPAPSSARPAVALPVVPPPAGHRAI